MISKKLLILFITIQFYGQLFSQTTLTLTNTYYIGNDVAEPSGLAFDKVNNQLFTVSDDDNIYRLSVTGNLLQTYNYNGDLEGVSMYNTPNTILVAIEDTHQIFEYNFVTSSVVATHMMNYSNMGSGNNGIEGVTYNPTTEEIYFLNEKNPGALIVANNNFNVTNEYPLSFAGDYSASYYVEETGVLWLGSDNSSTIYKCNTNGTVIETIPVTLNGNDLEKLEGIAIDHVNQILYAVTDSGQELLVYDINDTTLSLSNEKTPDDVIIYPIPTQGILTIKLKNFEDLIEMNLYNKLGQLVKNSSNNEKTIDVSKITSGIYFLRVITKNNIYKKNIIIE